MKTGKKKQGMENGNADEGPRCYGMQVRMTARAVSRLYSKALAQHDIEATEFSLLAAFDSRPNMTLSRLAELLDLERTTLVRNAKHLAKKGFIVSGPRPGGGITYKLTASGKRKLKAAFPSWQIVQDQIAAELVSLGAADVVETLKHLRNIGKPD